MRLLIVTQAVDSNHPVLGFFHRWIEEIAKQYDTVIVICLSEGTHHLPENVKVYSLGKEAIGEKWYRRFAYIGTFFKLIKQVRNEHDAVLVHMNPEYVILGGLLWKLWKKRVTLWYNHPHGGIRLWLASALADQILHTSPYAASARSVHKAIRMPVGIDTDLFAPKEGERHRNAIYMQGRIAPSKRVHVLLEAVRILRKDGLPVTLTLVGPEVPEYVDQLKDDFSDLIGTVSFLGWYKHADTPDMYRAHGVSVNLAAAGHFDKVAFESMACETPVIVASSAFASVVPTEWIVPGNDALVLAETIKRVIELPDTEYQELGKAERQAVVDKHSLKTLMEKLPQTVY